ncbi:MULTISPECIES: DUF998 domain-containing protein [Subtercola]|uniref:DUF998 domain-containing protein n=1 Tax=Subtercola vilae TaxID=2056433 RepID=A0A4T2C540_9MICO|nr:MULTISPECIES: DUF998 domain-containing protein [Subtercola]MEA9986200.1 DUF998 domain-containing protein [Subtercola sp. RTI3]TIH38321.1 DUF998 domain-containing protein [Subtercola vilae]
MSLSSARPVAVAVARRPALAAAALWAAAGLAYVAAEAAAAAAFPGYSYATNYISDLGVPEVGVFQGRTIDSPLHDLVNLAFVAQGILFITAAILLTRAVTGGARRTFLVLAALHSVGIVLVGVFHGSQASTAAGLEVLHVGGAGLAIVAGNVAVVVAGLGSTARGTPTWYRVVSTGLGMLGLASLVLLELGYYTPGLKLLPDGVLERGSVYSIIVWELLTAVTLLVGVTRRRPPDAGR